MNYESAIQKQQTTAHDSQPLINVDKLDEIEKERQKKHGRIFYTHRKKINQTK